MSLRFVKFRGSFRAHGGVASMPARLIVASRRSTRRMGSSSRRRRSRSRSRLVDHHSQSPPEHINELEPWFAFGIGIEEASHEKGINILFRRMPTTWRGGKRERESRRVVSALLRLRVHCLLVCRTGWGRLSSSSSSLRYLIILATKHLFGIPKFLGIPTLCGRSIDGQSTKTPLSVYSRNIT